MKGMILICFFFFFQDADLNEQQDKYPEGLIHTLIYLFEIKFYKIVFIFV